MYLYLEVGPKSVRFLELLPSVEPSPSIECRLLSTSLESNNRHQRTYKALFYAWKETTEIQTTAQIFILTGRSQLNNGEME